MKVLITPRSFGKNEAAPFELLEKAGVEIVRNPKNAILKVPELISAASDCDGIIIGVDPLTCEVLEKSTKLRAVAKYGVGLDNIDLDYCREHGIKVSRTVGANSAAVADYAFSLMLALARKVVEIDAECRKGNWNKISTTDVSGKVLGLVGLGAIGKEMVNRAKGFSMKVIAYDIAWDEEYAKKEGVERVSLEEICNQADFISLHVPLFSETKGIIGEKQLAAMKSNAFIINTARGGLIDDQALLNALKSGEIAGAGLDAFSEEPPENKEWYGLTNVLIGSHCAASTVGAANAMSIMAAQNIIRDLGLSENND